MVQQLWQTLRQWWRRWSAEILPSPVSDDERLPVGPKRVYRPLERVVLTDQVCRTLFDEFAGHRRGSRGEEEIGWVLMGVREEKEALVLATLPAGANRSAGVAHVRFNSTAQALASRIVRQWDRRLVIVGVVHTHPGSMRHPSDGDYRGDSLWVEKLRGGEGIFAIGTADGKAGAQPWMQTKAATPTHVQALGELSFCWYTLAAGDRNYRPIPVELTLGPDLARPLHPLWDTIELHAEPLDRLCRQLAQVSFETVRGDTGLVLKATIPLAQPRCQLNVLLDQEEVRFILDRAGEVSAIDPDETPLDRAVFLALAELARQADSLTMK